MTTAVAKVTTPAKGRPAPVPRGRGAVPAPSSERDSNYFAGVISELRKVSWPAPDELWRMTSVVIATVIIFAAIIGLADYLLGILLSHIYTGTPPRVTPTPR